MNVVICLAVVFVLLMISEWLWRTKRLRGEAGRKLIHIAVGSFVAFWPYFLSWREIQLLSVAFIAVVILSKHLHTFHAIYEVKRRTWGELFFPLAIGIAAIIAPAPIIFTAAILHLSIADGLAAVVGRQYGLLHQYKIRNYTKTLAGTMTFFLSSILIVAITVWVSLGGITLAYLPLIIWLPIATTLAENLSPWGLDNLLVPLLVIVVLQAARIT